MHRQFEIEIDELPFAAVENAQQLLSVLGWNQVEDVSRIAQQILDEYAIDLPDAAAQRQKMPLAVRLLREAEDRAARQVVGDAAQLTLAFVAYVFRLLALGDVAGGADDLQRLSVRIAPEDRLVD